jgi:hypothetical protein
MGFHKSEVSMEKSEIGSTCRRPIIVLRIRQFGKDVVDGTSRLLAKDVRQNGPPG